MCKNERPKSSLSDSPFVSVLRRVRFDSGAALTVRPSHAHFAVSVHGSAQTETFRD